MDASTSLAQRRFAVAIAATFFFSTAHAQTARVDVAGLKAGQQHDRFIVQYRDNAGVARLTDARDRVRRAVAASPAAYSSVPTVAQAIAPGAFLVRSSQPMSAVAAEAWMRRLAEDSAIEFVEVDATLREFAQPNDKWYASQLHLFGGYGVGADAAWGMSQGDGVIVGVVDSGPTPHPDLDAALLPGHDFVDDDRIPSTPECAATGGTHGTKTAGTIAAVTNNTRGVASVAPKVKVVPARVVTACGGVGHGASTANIVRAIEWLSGGAVEGVPANANPVEVINVSLGIELPCGGAMQGAITRAVARGTTVVAAAGNEGIDAAGVRPANCTSVVAVGGIDWSGRRPWYSNWGQTIDVAAPAQIYWPRVDDSAIDYDEGTSFSAPMVTGIVALMQSASSTPLTPARVETLLKASAKAFRSPQDKALGTGIANAPAALSMAQATNAPKFQGSYALVARGLLPGQQQYDGCLIVGQNGTATRPEFFRWGSGGAPKTCGHNGLNPQMVWDISPVTDSQGVTAHIIRSRVKASA